MSAEEVKTVNRRPDGGLTPQAFMTAHVPRFAADRNRDHALTLEEIQFYSSC